MNEYPKLYLAYGSNLNISQMRHRCPTAELFGMAKLRGYRLLFRGGFGAVATIEKKPHSYVPVALWKVYAEDEKALDAYEGWPRLYRKEDFKVRVERHRVKCFAYVMNGGALGSPSGMYLHTIEEGYDDMGFDLEVLEQAVIDSTEGSTL